MFLYSVLLYQAATGNVENALAFLTNPQHMKVRLSQDIELAAQ